MRSWLTYPIDAENPGQVARGTYYHWDEIKYRKAPLNLNREKWWILTKLQRSQSAEKLNIRGIDSSNLHFTMPNEVMKALHQIDQKARGSLKSTVDLISKEGTERYHLNLLQEESITSSQLEGAATTKIVARDMLESKMTLELKAKLSPDWVSELCIKKFWRIY